MARKLSWTLLGVIIALGASGWAFFHLQLAPWRPALDAREIATRVLGEHLAKQCPGTKILVLGNPFSLTAGQSSEISAFDQAEVRGLRLGFGTPGSVKEVFPALRADPLRRPASVRVENDTTTPLSFLVAQDAIDRVVRENPGFDLVVSLIGLPADIQRSAAWQISEKPRFALLLPDWRILGDPGVVREAFKSGKLVAAVVNRPGATAEDGPTGTDYQTEFKRRFLLVTMENVEGLMQTYPRLF